MPRPSKYPPEFRERCVRIARESERPLAAPAGEITARAQERPALLPGGFDEQAPGVAVAGLGDRPPVAPFPGGALAGQSPR